MSLKIKEIIMLVLLVAFVFVVSRQTSYKDIDVKQIATAVSSASALANMEEFGSTQFKKDFGLNANDFMEVCYYGHETVMNSETLLIVKTDNVDQANELKSIIETQIETNKELFKSYAVDQYDLLNNSVLEIKGDYLLYSVCENSDEVERIFTDTIEE